jgi:hypothetical protein
MGMIEIEPVRSRKDLKRFIKFPWKVYSGDPYWVPPLISERKAFFNPAKNPFYEHAEVQLFLARRAGEVVGTISAHINHNHNEFQEEKTGFFGFFECVEDYAVAEELLDRARDWVTEREMDTMRGPMSFSTNEECGLLVDGFDGSPVILMTYNPRYYVDFFERYGLKKAMDLYAYRKMVEPIPDGLVKAAEKAMEESNVMIRTIRLDDFEAEVERIRTIYNSAWSKNWGFVPMTEKEFYHLARELKPIVEPDFLLYAEVEGEPAGFSLVLPDANQALKHLNGRLFPFGFFKLLYYMKRINFLRVIVLGVLHKYHKLGLGAIFYMKIWKAGLEKGYKGGEMSWILENNEPMNRGLQMAGAEIYRTYRVYDLPLREVGESSP